MLRTDIADSRLSDALTRRGFEVEGRAVYRTLAVSRRFEEIPEFDLVVFASPSAVKALCQVVSESELRRLRTKKLFCIGPVTADAARENGFLDIVVPEVHTIDALVDEVRRRRDDE